MLSILVSAGCTKVLVILPTDALTNAAREEISYLGHFEASQMQGSWKRLETPYRVRPSPRPSHARGRENLDSREIEMKGK
jgi:hypothetical protein